MLWKMESGDWLMVAAIIAGLAFAFLFGEGL